MDRQFKVVINSELLNNNTNGDAKAPCNRASIGVLLFYCPKLGQWPYFEVFGL